jgi:hypothetical protein
VVEVEIGEIITTNNNNDNNGDLWNENNNHAGIYPCEGGDMLMIDDDENPGLRGTTGSGPPRGNTHHYGDGNDNNNNNNNNMPSFGANIPTSTWSSSHLLGHAAQIEPLTFQHCQPLVMAVAAVALLVMKPIMQVLNHQ